MIRMFLTCASAIGLTLMLASWLPREVRAQDPAQATSLFGQPLVPPPPSAEAQQVLERNLAEAQATLEKSPGNADALIWYGRRLAYLGRYREALEVYSKGIALHPNDARLYRHRGHRYLTTRRFDLAARDFEKAAALIRGQADEVEPDGQPNARNIPTSTLQSNIWYHLGLAYYLQGDFARAASAYVEGVKVSGNPDMKVAMSYWLYLALRRDGRAAEASAAIADIGPGLDIIENGVYYRLVLGFKDGSVSASWLDAANGLDRATMGYGIGAWLLAERRRDEAVAVWKPLVHTTQWASFGSMAAEADLKRAEVTLP